MKFDHLVKHNGTYYPAGTEVPVGVSEGDTQDNPEEESLDEGIEIEQEAQKSKRGRPAKKLE